MIQSIKPLIILFVLGLICQNFGPISVRLEGLLVITSLIVYIFICNRQGVVSNKSCKADTNLSHNVNESANEVKINKTLSANFYIVILSYIALIALATLIGWISNDILQLSVLAGLIFCAFIFSKWRSYSTGEHSISLFITIFFLFVILFYEYFSDCWYLIHLYADLFSTICGFIYARVLNLGPTSFGFFILLSFVIFHTIYFVLAKKRSLARFGFALLYLFATTIIVVGINLLVTHLLKKTFFAIDRNDLHTQFFLFLLMSPSLLFYKRMEIRTNSILIIKRNYKYAISSLIMFIVVFVFMFIPFFKTEPIEGKNIAFYKQGSLDWETPRFGTYGQRSGGMFGIMPKHLSLSGYNSNIIENITFDNLDEIDVLVMINLNKSLTRQELSIVWNYVSNGGSLLLLGDHTDLAGLMKNFNQILKIVNIKFKFDSAMPTRYTWDYIMDERLHPITNSYDIEIARSWWVGASLECTPPAEPLVVGKYCYSDWGYKNNAKNAFLGNRRFDYYEPLNDHVLAAYSRYGKGKVMAVGDTSSFHNTTFMVTNSFVSNVFRFLAGHNSGYTTVTIRILLGLLVLAAVLCSIFTFRGHPNFILPLSFTFVIGLTVMLSNCSAYSRHDDSYSFDKQDVAYIDFSHNERFDLMSWEDDSIGGLRNNIMRNKYFPLLMHKFNSKNLLKSKLLIIIAPTKSFSSSEIEAIKLFVEKGGKVIVSVGWEEVEASAPLLDAFGLGIDGTPLGWCNIEYEKWKVQFHEAWPVVFNKDDNVEVICEPLGYPAIVSKPYGKGSIIVIGDSYFLMNQNFEGSKKFSISNIILFRDLLLK